MKHKSFVEWSHGRVVLMWSVVAIVWSMSALHLIANVASAQNPSRVEVARINGVIDPFTDGYVERVLNVAREDNAQAVVFILDTPGGQLDATRTIVEKFFASSVPVIVYVSPSGARAGSAGVFITYAAHVAAMAPGTNIGAAHPVGIGQEITGTLSVKAENDAAAFIRSIAAQRGRNQEWGEDAVRKSVSITEKEAIAIKAVDLVATNIDDLLNQVDGRKLAINGREVTLQTRGAQTRTLDMNIFEEFFHILLDPNIALILLNVGSLAILVELYNPGATVPAIVGVICLVLAAVALFGLPTNWAAVILIVVAIVMFVLDIKVTGFALTVGGIIAFILGAFFLFRPFTPPEPTAPAVEVSPFVIAGLVVMTASFFIFVLGAAVRSRRAPVVTGTAPLFGAVGVATSDLNPDGQVLVRSEHWTATADRAPIHKGERVRVLSVEGLRLYVTKEA